mgnify:CR=1 FL=1
MKICQLSSVDFTLKHFLIPLIDAQLDQGYEVIAVCSDGDYIENLREEGYLIHTIPIYRSFNIIKQISCIWCLYKYFKKESFDIVHTHTPIASLAGRIAAYFAQIPYIIYTAHGFYFHDDMPTFKKWFHIYLERLLGKITFLLLTQSEEDRISAIKYKIIDKTMAFTIGNGVDKSQFIRKNSSERASMRRDLEIPKDAFVVGMVGRLVREKGVIEFLKAAELVNSENKNVYFILVGERLVSDHAGAVEEQIQSTLKQVGSHLKPLGLCSNMSEIYSTMDLFVLPSWREGMPRSIIEAMMIGLPIIATNIRGCREEVIENETGFLIQVKSPESIVKSINKFLNEPELVSKYGDNGRERAIKYFDENKIIRLQMDLIEKFCI